VLEHTRRRWRPWAWELTFAVLLGAVLVAGMRAGWLAMALVFATYMILMLRHENRELRRAVLTIPALAVVVLVAAFFASPLLQERLDVTRAFTFGSERAAGPAGEHAVDQSAMERIPIFRAALLMYRDHPVNGVGVRAYPYNYIDYALPGDVHVAKSDGRRREPCAPLSRGHGRYRDHWPGWTDTGLRFRAAAPPPNHTRRTPRRLSLRPGRIPDRVSAQFALCDLRHLHVVTDLVPGGPVERVAAARSPIRRRAATPRPGVRSSSAGWRP
jgi:hypothetical protein